MFACKACSGSDPAQDTVKFDASALAKQQQEAEQAAAAAKEAERRQQQEREEARLREEARQAEAEAQRRRAEEAELQRQQEEERRRAEEQERLARLQQEEEEQRRAIERAQAEQRAEQERQEREVAEARARKSAVAAFLKEHGFKGGVSDAKKSMMSTTYPLHTAAKAGNARMVEMLLKEGASVAQKNSSGKTAAQVAEKSNKNGSHAAALRALTAGPSAAGRAGGC